MSTGGSPYFVSFVDEVGVHRRVSDQEEVWSFCEFPRVSSDGTWCGNIEAIGWSVKQILFSKKTQILCSQRISWKVFYCQTLANISGQCRKKLDPKSWEMLKVGDAPNGYRLWNKSTRWTVIARDVKFNAKYFPYVEESGLEQLIVAMTYEHEGEEVQSDVRTVQT